MPNSNGRGAFGRRSGTVTVIDQPVRRSAMRTAKIAAIVTWLAVTLLATTVAASYWHPIIALFAGAFIGLAVAFVVAAFVIAWPVLRVIWWWAAEIITALAFVFGWMELAEHTLLLYRLVAVAVIAGLPASIPPVRRRLIGVAWCLIIRHRIRTCFNEFIISNRTGSLPLILWARPTPVGVRTWIWLRPGLALDDIQERLDLIAVACWASSATVEAASERNSAHIRMDFKLRDALTATVNSPLVGLVVSDPPDIERDDMPVPSALDLPDVAAADVAFTRPPRNGTKVPTITPAPDGSQGDDIEDWI
jgi:ABC-type multidrug transport system fused ATPase/permease subunit